MVLSHLLAAVVTGVLVSLGLVGAWRRYDTEYDATLGPGYASVVRNGSGES